MKLLRLDLKAFGPFTESQLDFSDGEHGLHIVYGTNEAGKSTTLRAVYALLFGVPERTTDNFVHDNPNLRLGGHVSRSDGSELVFQRRKGRTKTLLDSDGQPIADEQLQFFLGGVGADFFDTMFGINHDRLVQGSEAILNGGGAVGQSLFSAGLGGASITEVVKAFDGEAESLFRSRGQNQTINQAIAEYKAARKDQRSDTLSSRHWVEQEGLLTAAEAEQNTLAGELGELKAENDRVQRVLRALPNLVRRRQDLERLRQLEKVTMLAGDFAERRRKAAAALEGAQQALKTNLAASEQLRSRAESLKIPTVIIDRATDITALNQLLGSHRKASGDSGKLAGQIEQLTTEAKVLLTQLRPDLKLEEAAKLRPTTAQRSRIRELSAQYQTLIEKQRQAVSKVEDLTRRKSATEAELASAEPGRDCAELTRLVTEAQRHGDVEESLSRSEASLDTIRQTVESTLERLASGCLTAAELERAGFPLPETIDRFEEKMQQLEVEKRKITEQLDQGRIQVSDYARQIDELKSAGTVPTEHDLITERSRRDQAWQQVRGVWLDGQTAPSDEGLEISNSALAGRYELQVTEADQAGDRLRREAGRVAKMASLEALHAAAEQSRSLLEPAYELIENQMTAAGDEWRALWSPTGITPTSPREMRAWTTHKDGLLKHIATHREAKSDALRLQGLVDSHRTALSAALSPLGKEPASERESLAALISRCGDLAEAIADTARKRDELGKRLAGLDQDLDGATEESRDSEETLTQWRLSWTSAVEAIGLPGDSLPAEADDVVAGLDELFTKLDEAQQIESRIQGINRDAQEFEAAVQALVSAAAPNLTGSSPEEAAAQLSTLLTAARTDSKVLESLEEQIGEKHEAVADSRGTIDVMTQRQKELCAEAGVPEPSGLAEAERQSDELKATRKSIESIEEQLIEHSGVDIEQLVAEADGADPSELSGRSDELQHRIAEIEGQRSELDQKIGSQRQAIKTMDGSDKAAAASEVARSKLAEIRNHTHRYVRLRLAASLLRREVERYRAENQAPLLNRASQLFAELTLSSFARLEAAFDESDRPVLEGVRSDGARVGVAGMSTGTRDQLYLALRLASLEKYIATSEPMPFVVDDILTSFDDDRAAAAIRVLAELSKTTQVMFFTHHQRLVELAGDAAGDMAFVHELSGTASR